MIQSARFLIIIVLLSSFLKNSLAQNKIIQDEKESGFKGDFNEKVTVWDDAFTFFALGDFGRVGAYHQKEVARELGKAAISMDAEFIVSVGDNFYPNGVASTQDPHWQQSFENIYTHPNLFIDWYVALGNHDYQGSTKAVLDYTNVSRRWRIPSSYYSKTFKLGNGKKLLFVVMDSNPFIDSYHKNYEKFPDLRYQDTAAQRQWLVETLNATDTNIVWKVVVGHHPLYSGGKRKELKDTKEYEAKFADVFELYRVDAYICGHEHDLQIIQPKGRKTIQYLSGAGSETRPSGNREGTIYAGAKPGFMAFSIKGRKMMVQTIGATEMDSEILHQFTIEK